MIMLVVLCCLAGAILRSQSQLLSHVLHQREALSRLSLGSPGLFDLLPGLHATRVVGLRHSLRMVILAFVSIGALLSWKGTERYE